MEKKITLRLYLEKEEDKQVYDILESLQKGEKNEFIKSCILQNKNIENNGLNTNNCDIIAVIKDTINSCMGELKLVPKDEIKLVDETSKTKESLLSASAMNFLDGL